MLQVWKQQNLSENAHSKAEGSSGAHATQTRRSRRSCQSLIVYIAPMKALACEKVTEWKARFENNAHLRKKVVEVTGDTPVKERGVHLEQGRYHSHNTEEVGFAHA